MRRQFNPSGLLIAFQGFFLTRFTVTFALSDSPTSFIVGGIVPLVLGLSLSAFGVALVFGSFERWYVQTIVLWTVLGAGVIGILVIATIYARDLTNGLEAMSLFSNLLIGGSVGGALTGVYAAQNRRYQLELQNRQNRLVLLNRLLHDEVMNAVTVIRGIAPFLKGEEPSEIDSVEAIVEKTTSIENVMESVQDIAEPGREAEVQPIGVADALTKALERARERHPDATFVAEAVPDDVSAYANRRLVDVLYQLLVNGVEHADTDQPRVAVDVKVREDAVTLSVIDEGPGLPDHNRKALEKGTTITNGAPTAGLGLYIVRLFVRAFQGSIDTDVTDEGTTISITLGRVGGADGSRWTSSDEGTTGGLLPQQLGAIIVVSLLAGAVMGGYVQLTAGIVPVIGALYGIENAFVGVLTHEFHSVVFGLIYTGLLTLAPRQHADSWTGRIGTATAWGAALWLVASGIIMPVWLNLVGLEEPVPNLNLHSLVAHLIWGLVLGGGDHLAQRWNLPERLRELLPA